jgi:hypothetical protein
VGRGGSPGGRWRRGAAVTAALVLVGLLTPSVVLAAADPQWTQRALALQYELAGDMELRNAPWVGTHNSFNSRAEMGPTLSNTDSNQQISLVDQLQLGVRSIELDLHWFFSARSGGFAPVVCHALEEEQAHGGCSVEKDLGQVLDEIAVWLRSHRDQVLLLYLEDDLGSQGHDESARTLLQKLGNMIYRPPGGGARCVALPLDLSRDEVLASAKQVIVVSDCGRGAAWRSVIFDWSNREEERPHGYLDFPRCDPKINRATYNRTLVRYYEDSTELTARTGTPDEGIPPQTAVRLARCGVDLTGLDQLVSTDGRLEALVWSWAPGEPRAGRRCAVQRRDSGRWRVLRCRAHRRVACRARNGSWSVSKRKVRARSARRLCRKRSRSQSHAVPRTGFEGQLLRAAMKRAGARSVWLGYRRRAGRWVALDRR